MHLYTLFIDIISSYVVFNDVTISITRGVIYIMNNIFTVKAAIYGQLTQPSNSFETNNKKQTQTTVTNILQVI